MATASFDGPALKLKRARQHLFELQTVISRFTKSQEAAVKVEYDAATNHRLWVLEVPEQPDGDKINPLVGDFLYNLRSALDHLAWQLVIANGKDPKGTGVAFPVFDELPTWRKKAPPMIRDMAPVVQEAIHEVQPLHQPSPKYRTDPLLLMHRLNNIYKHRYFKVAQSAVKAGAGWELPDDFKAGFPQRMEGRAILGAWEVSDPDRQVNYMPSVEVVFADTPWGDEWVLDVAEQTFAATQLVAFHVARVGGLLPT